MYGDNPVGLLISTVTCLLTAATSFIFTQKQPAETVKGFPGDYYKP